MSDNDLEIAKKVTDGSYFRDAMDWYAVKYLHVFIQRYAMIFFATVSFILFIYTALTLKSISGSVLRPAIPIYVDSSLSYFSNLKSLEKKPSEEEKSAVYSSSHYHYADLKSVITNSDKSTQALVAAYIIIDYIVSREEYFTTALSSGYIKKTLKKIKATSTKQVLSEYSNYMSSTNPYSPIVRYKDKTDREIFIESLTFLNEDKSSGKAKIVFKATERPLIGEEKENKWEVILNYRMPDVDSIANNSSPLRFVVSYYKVKLISGEAIGEPKKVAPAVDAKQVEGANNPNNAAPAVDAKQVEGANNLKNAAPAVDAKQVEGANNLNNAAPAVDAKQVEGANNLNNAAPAVDAKKAEELNEPKKFAEPVEN